MSIRGDDPTEIRCIVWSIRPDGILKGEKRVVLTRFVGKHGNAWDPQSQRGIIGVSRVSPPVFWWAIICQWRI